MKQDTLQVEHSEISPADGPCIFENEWWYDAAADGKWEQVEFSEAGCFTARLIVYKKSTNGLSIVGMPPLAHTMRPMISFQSIMPKHAHTHVIRALCGLKEAMSRCDQFHYTLPPDSGMDSSFLLAGYSLKANYTFQIPPSSKIDPMSLMDPKLRSHIKNGNKRIIVDINVDIEKYMRLYMSFCKSKSLKEVIDYDAIRRIWEACHIRKRSAILTAVNCAGEDIAAAILFWDDRRLYYWLNCRSLALNDSTASSLIIAKAIKLAMEKGLTFDADGFATREQGIYNSRFGMLPKLRIEVSLTNSKARLKTAIRNHFYTIIGPKPKKILLSIKNRAHGSKSAASPNVAE